MAGVARVAHPVTESWMPAKVMPALKPERAGDGGCVGVFGGGGWRLGWGGGLGCGFEWDLRGGVLVGGRG